MSDAPRILGADLSKTSTGIAEGPIGRAPNYHTIRGDGVPTDQAAEGLFLFLQRLTDVRRGGFEYDAWFYEDWNIAPFLGKWNEEKRRIEMKSNPAALVALPQMIIIFRLVARLRGIPCEAVPASTARKAFLGAGYPDEPKKRAKATAEAIGWRPPNLDCADASSLYYYGALHTAPRLAQVITPMQQRQAATRVIGSERADALDVPLTTPLRVDRNGQEHVDYRAARGLFKRRAAE